MKRIADKLSRYAIAFAVLGILSTALPILKLPQLSIDNSIEVWLRQDSDLDSLRGHPRFQALVELRSTSGGTPPGPGR